MLYQKWKQNWEHTSKHPNAKQKMQHANKRPFYACAALGQQQKHIRAHQRTKKCKRLIESQVKCVLEDLVNQVEKENSLFSEWANSANLFTDEFRILHTADYLSTDWTTDHKHHWVIHYLVNHFSSEHTHPRHSISLMVHRIFLLCWSRWHLSICRHNNSVQSFDQYVFQIDQSHIFVLLVIPLSVISSIPPHLIIPHFLCSFRPFLFVDNSSSNCVFFIEIIDKRLHTPTN